MTNIKFSLHVGTHACTPCACACNCWYRRTGNFRARKFPRFRDSMYYANILRFLFSQLEVFTKFHYCPIHLLVPYIELTADNETEAREKLSSISDGLKLFQDGRAGRVSHIKNFTCKLNFAIFNFVVQPQPRKPQKFVDHKNLLTTKISRSTVLTLLAYRVINHVNYWRATTISLWLLSLQT